MKLALFKQLSPAEQKKEVEKARKRIRETQKMLEKNGTFTFYNPKENNGLVMEYRPMENKTDKTFCESSPDKRHNFAAGICIWCEAEQNPGRTKKGVREFKSISE